MRGDAGRREFAPDSALEERRFEPLVPLTTKRSSERSTLLGCLLREKNRLRSGETDGTNPVTPGVPTSVLW
jgi:hypothetical protein